MEGLLCLEIPSKYKRNISPDSGALGVQKNVFLAVSKARSSVLAGHLHWTSHAVVNCDSLPAVAVNFVVAIQKENQDFLW